MPTATNTTTKALTNLDALTSGYATRATTAKAALDARAAEIKQNLDALLERLGVGAFVKDEKTEALINLLGASTVHTYVSAVRASRALIAIREDEKGFVKTPEVKQTSTVIPSVADRLNRTALAETAAPAATTPAAASKATGPKNARPAPMATPAPGPESSGSSVRPAGTSTASARKSRRRRRQQDGTRRSCPNSS